MQSATQIVCGAAFQFLKWLEIRTPNDLLQECDIDMAGMAGLKKDIAKLQSAYFLCFTEEEYFHLHENTVLLQAIY